LLSRFKDVIHTLGNRDPDYDCSRAHTDPHILVHWVPPPGDWVALITDGAAKGNPDPAAA